MGAVFTSAARAPLTSVASVVEMTGDYALTLPVMLAVAIATATSRAVSYGTIYTTKLLCRGYDVDRAAPWRAFGDMTAADAMRPFPAPLTVAAGRDGHTSCTRGGDGGATPGPAPLPGTVTYRSDPHAVYAGESLTQTLRQLAAYGRDGLPVLSGDGGHAAGWITNDSVLRAIAREIGAAPPQAVGAPAARAAGAGLPGQFPEPPTPLPGYQVLEITIRKGSPGAGKAIGTIAWPRGYLPVSVLRNRSLHEPHPDLVLAPGDRISLLTREAPGNGTDPAGTANHTPSPS
jgi:CIC family chloride channel protein